MSASDRYGQAQADELEVLQAIYMDSLEVDGKKSAWNSKSKAFTLSLKSIDESVSLVLRVQFTPTYPKTSPVISVDYIDAPPEASKVRIESIIKNTPALHRGEVIIHTIAADIFEVLEDAVQQRESGVLPSLEDERAKTLATTSAQLLAQAVTEQEKTRAADAEDEVALLSKVTLELQRRENAKQDPAERQEQTGISLHDVEILEQDHSHDMMQTSRVKTKHATARVLALRIGVLQLPTNTVERRTSLRTLERDLSTLKSLSHASIVCIHDFELSHIPTNDQWQLSVLTDLTNRGTLQEVLEHGQILSANQARQWMLSLLEALDFYHRHGVVHGSIDCRNIVLNRANESTTPLLSGAGYSIYVRDKLDSDHATQSSWPVPEAHAYTRKSDIFSLGVVFCQMLFGNAVFTSASPSRFLHDYELSSQLRALLEKLLAPNPAKRPTAFEAMPAEFLRRDDLPILATSERPAKRRESNMHNRQVVHRPSMHAVATSSTNSRYINDFSEVHRIGSGGFGTVVKARNKIDGGIYAIKKIRQESASQLEKVLSEVMVLHRLNHPYIVRYYSAWVEIDAVETDTGSLAETLSGEQELATASESQPFGLSSRGLDFVSSGGIQFGYDTDEDETGSNAVSSSSDASTSALSSHQDRRPSGLARTALRTHAEPASQLFIQMEYCERRTLRTLLADSVALDQNRAWRVLGQLCEGLAHIHGLGIIHRDLKPDNVFIDIAGDVKIGDFGLATPNRTYNGTSRLAGDTSDLTRSVGTAMYIAPELESGSTITAYDERVDMYSLGIMFFEMSFPFQTAMERLQVLRKLRKDCILPSTFQSELKEQGKLITKLINQIPQDRPRSIELLQSGAIPLNPDDTTIQAALRSLSDVRSPYHQRILSALFAQVVDQKVRDVAWDANDATNTNKHVEDPRMASVARTKLTAIFRRHGAEESRQPYLFPRSTRYSNQDVFQVLDSTGNILQLPFDFTVPCARELAHHAPAAKKSFVFGNVFRERKTGGAPRTNGIVDFLITAADEADQHAEEAEVIKVLDEVITQTPALASLPMAFHMTHWDILDLCLDYCQIETTQKPWVLKVLSKLNAHAEGTWPKVRAELQAAGVSSLALDDLAQFDFCDSVEKAFARMHAILQGTQYLEKLQTCKAHLTKVCEQLSSLRTIHKVFFTPLISYNADFYTHGIIFACVHERRTRTVFAAGGRFDALVKSFKASASPACHAVGASIAWDSMLVAMARHGRSETPRRSLGSVGTEHLHEKRCEVLIYGADTPALQRVGTRLLVELWDHEIGAEMVTNRRKIKEIDYAWIVTIKHEAAATLRVRNVQTEVESEVNQADLVNHVRYTRQRGTPQASLQRQVSQNERERRGQVQVLFANHNSKKGNKFDMINAAQKDWSDRVEEWKRDAPMLIIEDRHDVVINALKGTRLSDGESYRKAVQTVALNDRQYIAQTWDLLKEYRDSWKVGDGVKEACIYNVRTRTSILYDLSA